MDYVCKKRVVAFTLGDPYDPASRSGVNNAVFSRMSTALELSAYDCSLRGIFRLMSALKYFSINKNTWRRKCHQNSFSFERRSVICDTILRKHNYNYDAVYQDGAMFFPHSNTKLFVTNHDANIVLTARGGEYSVGSHYAQDKELLRAGIRQERMVYERADRIFVRSRWVKQSLVEDFSISDDKICINPSGVHLKGITDRDKEYHAKNILFVGKDSTLKGFDILLKAFSILSKEDKQLTLHIVGNSRAVKDIENVKYYGYLGRDQAKLLKDLYLLADLFVLPSRYDAFPKVLIEAGAFKVPCISTNVCGIPEIVEHGKNGFLVEPGDYKALAGYADEILHDAPLSKKMGDVGYANYNTKFNWDRHVHEIIDYIYENA